MDECKLEKNNYMKTIQRLRMTRKNDEFMKYELEDKRRNVCYLEGAGKHNALC